MRDQEITYTDGERQGNLGRYQLLKRIGHGSTGEIWLGIDPSLRRQVALKTLPPSTQNDRDYITRFQREVQAIAALRHPHILPIHDGGVQLLPNGQLFTYIVMPYIDGGSLSDLLKQRTTTQQKITPSEALTFLAQAADALDYAHAQGVLHRNIKPTNMLLRSEHELLLTDFGIVGDKQSSTMVNVAGTTEYLAPEQIQGNIIPASDIYSLAVVAYQLLTNQFTFPAEANTVPLIQQSSRTYQFPPDLPPACKEVLLRGMAKEPDARYPSASAFVEALQNVFSTAAGGRKMTRRTLLIGGGGGVALAGLGLWALSIRLQTGQQQAKSSLKVDPNAPLIILQEHKKPVQTLTWAPTKNVFVTASDEEAQVKLWDLAQLQPQKPAAFTSSLTRIWTGANIVATWAPTETALAIASKDGDGTGTNSTSIITVWDSTLKAQVAGLEQGFQVPAPSVEGLVCLKQRYLVAVWNDPTPGTKQSYLGIWDMQQPDLKPQPARLNQLLTSRAPLDPQRALAVTYDGTRIAICTTNGAMIGSPAIVNNAVIWQPASPSLLQYSSGSTNDIQALAWSNGGGSLLGILQNKSNNKIIIWNIPQAASNLPAPSSSTYFSALAFAPTPGTSLLAAGTEEGNIY
ncbi:MAG TPA: serine/threonine-protein kinase, partial [Ktedonobacteraceae bacterium]